MTGERLGNMLGDFIISVFLARLLAPSEFGLIAMVGVFISLLSPFVDAGLGSALMRKKDATAADYATVFWSNIGLSSATYIVIFLCAPLVAGFYGEPPLTQIVRVLGLVLIVNSLNIVQNIRLAKVLDFRSISFRSLTSNILSGAVGLYLAYSGWSYWALVVRQLVNAVIATILYWSLGSWLPSLRFSKDSFKDFFGFGSKLLFSSLLNTGFGNLYPLMIGKFYAASALGYYNRAVTLRDIPQTLFSQVTGKVSYPVLVELQDSPARLKDACRRLMQIVSFVYFPMLMGLMGISESLVLVLLTEKWAEAIPMLKALTFVGLLYPIHSLNLNILTLKKRSDLFLYLEIFKKGLTVIAVLITFRWGIMGLIYGQVAQSFLSLLINTHYSNKFIGYSMRQQLKDILPNFVAALVMGLLVMWGSEALGIYTWWGLLLWPLLGSLFYLAVSAAFNRKDLLYLYNFSMERYRLGGT